MKKITIISPDVVPLPIKKEEFHKMVNPVESCGFIDRYTKADKYGVRAWKTAEILSKNKNLEVTLLIPDLNYPADRYIDKSKINFHIAPYNYKVSLWNWSEELSRKLKNEHAVIVQSTAGAGFINCIQLPSNVNLIVDGWSVLPTKLPGLLLNYPKEFRKFSWDRAMQCYKDLLARANCILYSNYRQLYFYESELFSINKLSWKAYQFSPLQYAPYGVDTMERKEIASKTSTLKLLWYGPLYPWYKPEVLTKDLANVSNVEIDFIDIKHPRYQKTYTSYFKDLFTSTDEVSNITYRESYYGDIEELFSEYDAGILVSREWLEDAYSTRPILLDMLAAKLPVITNKSNVLYEEFPDLRDAFHVTDSASICSLIKDIDKSKLIVPDTVTSFLKENLSWDSALSGLSSYVEKF